MHDGIVLALALGTIATIFGGAVWWTDYGRDKMSELRDAAGAVTYMRVVRGMVLGVVGTLVVGVASCQLGEAYLQNQREAVQLKAGMNPMDAECAAAVGREKTSGYQRDICLTWIRHGTERVMEARAQ